MPPGDEGNAHSQSAGEPGGGSIVRSRRRPNTARFIATTLALLMIGFIATLVASGQGDEPKVNTSLIGRLAPDIEGPTIDGGQVSVTDLRGRWVVLNFFASWCTPCLIENPELAAFNNATKDGGRAVLIGVTFDNSAADALAFFEKNEGGWPVIDDPDNQIAVRFGIAQIPETFVIAPDGTIVQRFSGGVRKAELDATIAEFDPDFAATLDR